LRFFGTMGTDEEVDELLTVAVENKDVVARRWKKMIVDQGRPGLTEAVREACEKVGLEIVED